jgi:hypothetical protein
MKHNTINSNNYRAQQLPLMRQGQSNLPRGRKMGREAG